MSGLNPEIEKMKEIVTCRRCKGTGKVPKGLDMIDDMIDSLEGATIDEVEDMINQVISAHGIKKSKQAIFKTVMRSLVFKIRHKAM